MVSHEELKGQVADLAIGALEGAEARRVEAHVAACPECAAELQSLTGTAGLLRTLPPIPAPPAGEASLLDGARRAAGRMSAAQRPARRVPRWLLGLALGGAGAAAAVVVSLQLGRAPASKFDEGRDALEGRGPPPAVAAAPQSDRAELAKRSTRAAGEAGAAPPATAPTPTPTPTAAPRSPPAPTMSSSSSSNDAVQPRRSRSSSAIGIGDADGAATVAGALQEAKAGPDSVERQAAGPAATQAARQSKVAAAADLAEPAPAHAAEAVAGPGAAAPASKAKAEPGPTGPPTEVRGFAGCEGESSRALWRDAAGRLTRRERQGRLRGVAYRVSESYDTAGRLSGARLEAGGQVVTADRAGAAGGRLSGLVPGLALAPDAATAETAPPRCAP